MAASRDGVEINYDTYGEAGEAPAVVLVHGWAGNRTYWAQQVDALAGRYQVIRLDLGGHGESGSGRADWFRSLGNEPESSTEDVDAFLAPFRSDFPGAVDRFVRNMFPADADGELVDHLAVDMASAPQEAALGSLGYALNREPPLLAALDEIEAPVIAINPDVQPTGVDSLRQHGVEPRVLKGVGHFLMIEDAEPFNPVLLAALESFSAT